MSTSRALQIADRILDSDVLCVTFSGGEPLLREDIWRIIERLKEKRICIAILTNGSLITKYSQELCNLLRDPGDLVQISVDAADPICYRAQRGSDLFFRSITGIRTLVQLGVYVRAHCVVSPINVFQLEAIYSLVDRLSVDEFSIVPVYPKGKGIALAKTLNLIDYFRAILCILDRAEADTIAPKITFKVDRSLCAESWRSGFSSSLTNGLMQFYVGDDLEYLVINVDGSLYPGSRPVSTQRLGSLLQSSIDEICGPGDGRPVVRDLSDTICRLCPAIELCRGGDKEAAIRYFGTINAPDPDCPIVKANPEHATTIRTSRHMRRKPNEYIQA